MFALGSSRANVIKVFRCWDLKSSWLVHSDNFHIKHSQLKSKKRILLLMLLYTLQALPGPFKTEACSAYQYFSFDNKSCDGQAVHLGACSQALALLLQ